MTDWQLDVFVPGTPAPQGSKNGFAAATGKGAARVYTGKVLMSESSKKVKPWRKLVDAVCRQAWDGRDKLDGPLVLEVEFVLLRLASTPKSRPSGPHTVYPDLSKLVRSTEDAITSAGVWADDARVVRTVSSKRRAELGEPTGARIRVAAWVPMPASAVPPGPVPPENALSLSLTTSTSVPAQPHQGTPELQPCASGPVSNRHA